AQRTHIELQSTNGSNHQFPHQKPEQTAHALLKTRPKNPQKGLVNTQSNLQHGLGVQESRLDLLLYLLLEKQLRAFVE
ncbi:hypothetical protein RA276_32580, partial [Pseudomonas syringae pv. tagetis]|uniref:hypothetical protein n=1 Tax=Pseudomonas syringae group genomosp. 7 TaxID=251699 RepID=UPI00376FA5BE